MKQYWLDVDNKTTLNTIDYLLPIYITNSFRNCSDYIYDFETDILFYGDIKYGVPAILYWCAFEVYKL